MPLTRRQFLKTTLATTAACGVAHTTVANTQSAADEIIDTHVYLGHWPHQQLASEDPKKLVDELRRNNIVQAWVGSFDGLFHKDIAAVNQRLADACSRSRDALIPFGTVNPTLPDWEEDVRRCHEVFHMRGVRLHPNYQGYTLEDARFTRLLELAATHGLIVQLVACFHARQHFLLSPPTDHVDLKPLADKIDAHKKLQLVISNSELRTSEDDLRSLARTGQVYFDFGRAREANYLRELIGAASSERIVFGSGAPLHGFEQIFSKLHESELSSADRRNIAMANAGNLLRRERQEGRP